MKFILFLLLFFIVACNTDLDVGMSEEEIDDYVEELKDTALVFDVERSPVYSRDDETYRVDAFYLEDSVVFFNANEMSEKHTEMVNYYLKNNKPVKIESFRMDYKDTTTIITERKMYLDGEVITTAYERSAPYDRDIEQIEFEEVVIGTKDYEIGRPRRAVEQAGEFAMQFGDFLIINPDAYLVLENKESDYGVALYIKEGDMLLDELYEKPENYRGKVINVQHEFEIMNGIERMIYRGGIVMENKD